MTKPTAKTTKLYRVDEDPDGGAAIVSEAGLRYEVSAEHIPGVPDYIALAGPEAVAAYLASMGESEVQGGDGC